MEKDLTTTLTAPIEIVKSNVNPYHKVCVGTPTLGTIRMEWHQGRLWQSIPVNWSAVQVIETLGGYYPLGFLVADAQNIIAKRAVEGNFEWMFLYEDDVIPPNDAFIHMWEYMDKGDVPIVSGIYHTKSRPAEPLVFRGRGNGVYKDWKRGDLVWCDGVPTGFVIMHMSIIREMWKDCEDYVVRGIPTRRLFRFPREQFEDPETHHMQSLMGTSDLDFCTRVMEGGYFKKAGWSNFQRRKYPFLIDTNIWCLHIDQTGELYP